MTNEHRTKEECCLWATRTFDGLLDKPLLSDAQIAEIERRANAATAGPWAVGCGHSLDGDLAVYEARGLGNGDNRIACWIWKGETADFVANSRTDIPALIDTVRELLRQRDILKVAAKIGLARIESDVETNNRKCSDGNTIRAAIAACQETPQ